VSYAGDLTPKEAWTKLEAGTARLVDVRTTGEWAHIGVPDTPSVGEAHQDPLFIQWTLAGGVPNPQFIGQLEQEVAAGSGTELVFLCRSGARSVAAAMAATQAGFTSYNVLEGFEGEPDRHGERTVNGWKNRGLPTNPGRR
jgi:rhodanese-related sulfurtransferase